MHLSLSIIVPNSRDWQVLTRKTMTSGFFALLTTVLKQSLVKNTHLKSMILFIKVLLFRQPDVTVGRHYPFLNHHEQ